MKLIPVVLTSGNALAEERPGFCAGSWECSEVAISVHKLPTTTMPARTGRPAEPEKVRQNKGLNAGSPMLEWAGLRRGLVFF